MESSRSESDGVLPASFWKDEVIATFMEAVTWSAIEDAAISGSISVADLSNDEVIDISMRRCLEPSRTGASEDVEGEAGEAAFGFGSRHDRELLVEGNSFLDRGLNQLAILLYATWIEHWINRIILMRSVGFGTPPELAAALVRSTRLELKIGKIWSSLELERFDRDLSRAIVRVMESRNGFVHFKWTASPEDEHGERINQGAARAVEAKRTVEALMKLEDEIFFDGRSVEIKEQFRREYVRRMQSAGGPHGSSEGASVSEADAG
ncbi:hypothetical protein [Kitasatospora purpeofusca]|uniref:hypothetical protein n=1 Tax=Kitasatospora purpeofusca TaxID=67352 RepID=UPI00369BF4E0